jgi:hypothetical protein
MAKLHTAVAAATIAVATIAVALAFCAFIPLSAAAQGRDVACKHTLAQHTEALRMLEAEAAKARALAEANPLYESDVAYYASVLRDERACVKMLAPVVSASR